MTGTLTRKRRGRFGHTEKRPCKDRGRDRSYTATSRNSRSHQELAEERKNSPLNPREHGPADTLILDVQPLEV